MGDVSMLRIPQFLLKHIGNCGTSMGYFTGHGRARHRDIEDQRGGRQTEATMMKGKALGLHELF